MSNQETVGKYFNIGQGGASSNVVLDSIPLSNVFSKVKRNRLIIPEEERQADDKIKQRRDAYAFLNDIEERIEMLRAELEIGRSKLQRIYDAFGDDDVGEEELSEFVNRIKKFYEAANNAQVNVKEISLDGIKKLNPIAKAISDIATVIDEKDPLTILMAFLR